MRHFTLSALVAMFMFVFCGSASAQATVVETGTATGIFYAFYTGVRPIDYLPVTYTKYDDGSIVLNGFANGQGDLRLTMGELDEYYTYPLIVEDSEGVGANDTYSFEGWEDYLFDVYRFATPVAIGPDKMEFLFLDGSSYYDPSDDTIVFDYVSAVDNEEYMFLVDISVPYEEGSGPGIETDSDTEAELSASGVATGYYCDFDGNDIGFEDVPVAYERYTDGSIVLLNFWDSGYDMTVTMSDYDATYNVYNANVVDCNGLGFNYNYNGYDYYLFEEDVVYNGESAYDLYLNGYVYYDPEYDELVLTYQSNTRNEFDLFIVSFGYPFEGGQPDGIALPTSQPETHKASSYDLQGRRLVKLQQGVNIVGGKKIIMK